MEFESDGKRGRPVHLFLGGCVTFMHAEMVWDLSLRWAAGLGLEGNGP